MNRLGSFLRSYGRILLLTVFPLGNLGLSTSASAAAAEQAGEASPEQFRLLTTADRDAARGRTVSLAQKLDGFLATGSPSNRAAWHAYLNWNELMAQLQASQPDPALLGELLTKFYSGEPGLELPEFVATRDALMAYRRQLLAAADEHLEKLFRDQLNAVSTVLDSGEPLNEQQRLDLSNRLEWLEQLGQAPLLIDRTRQRFGKPNLRISASNRAISKGFTENVQETTQVNEMILKTRVRGTADTRGIMTATLVPSNDLAVIELTMHGTAHSDTVGYQSPVTIFSRGVTQIVARKRLLIDDVGIRAEPAVACCSTDSQICRISAGNRLAAGLIEKIAWKQAGQQQSRAEQISARRAERRIAERMDQRTLQRIAESNTQLRRKFQVPLRQRNIFPRSLQIWTTTHDLHVTACQALPTQLAAETDPPTAPAHDVLVQVHQSTLANTALNAIGGMTVSDERAVELVKEVTGEVPEELQLKQDEDPWSITFDLQHPLSVAFDQDQVRVAIRGRRFVRGDQVVRQITEIAATYRISAENGRAKLVRQGEVEVNYPEKESERLSLTELRNKTFLTNKFEGLFKPELDGEKIKFPQRWAKLKDLALGYVSADKGWLSMGWK